MATLTIDTPLQFKQTHFVSALEAAYFLIGLEVKKTRSQNNRLHKISQKTTWNSATPIADMTEIDNPSSLDGIKSIYS